MILETALRKLHHAESHGEFATLTPDQARALLDAYQRTHDALREARPYVYTRTTEPGSPWREETARSVLERVDKALKGALLIR